VDPSLSLPYVSLLLKPSAAQKADLDQLLAQQQDPSSPNYHGWLTPEQYADRFGVTQADMDKMVAWLGQHGLTIKSVARARNAIAFGGTASQIESTFGVEMHRYQLAGQPHYANTANPTIPAALQGVVLGIHGLHDFRLKPRLSAAAHPRDNTSQGEALAPGDIATIYNITPLYNAGIDGAGLKLAVAGQTSIEMSDITAFRNYFGLPANNPTVMLIPGSPDPGINQGDLQEADLDLELSGAVARNATILFVYATEVFDAWQYAIDQDLAPVISISYGDCELDMGRGDADMYETWATQANAQGQTIFAASGDSGAADCFGEGDGPAIDDALSVDVPAALPQVTGVGGTTFNEGGGRYWSSTNGASQTSALGYIPETAWNDSATEGSPVASGGGASTFFSKPSWQTGTGVPNDGHRDVPDVAMSASPVHDPYVFYNAGSLSEIGGTSAGPPQFAGIAILLNQYLIKNGYQQSAGLGNMNPALYQNLALVPGVFHDITTGNNIVIPCNQPCTGAAIGYNATVGYDRVTGWGSPDVYSLVMGWHNSGVTAKDAAAVTVTANPNRVAFTGTTSLTATVTATNGGAPTGTVTFSLGTETLGTATVNSGGVATLTFSGVLLAVGANTVTVQYNGDNTHNGAATSVDVVESTPSNGFPSVTSLANAASFTQSFAPGGILSIFGTQLAPATSGAPGVPLPTMLAGTTVTIDDIPAPFYYVSDTQLNIQIPFEVTPNSSSSLRVENNGESAFTSFTVNAAAPAIFTMNSQGTGQGAILDNSTYQLVNASHPATPGKSIIQIYCLGLGAVSAPPADGAASPSSPPAQTTTQAQVAIGNQPATVYFSGLAPGFVGLYQVDALVPATAAAGSAVPVVVSIGGVTSNTATIVVASP
jgi:uncharacterized protein (TIGR03437 family)